MGAERAAIPQDSLLPGGGSEVSQNKNESCRKTFAFFRYDVHCVSQDVCPFGLILLKAHQGDLHACQ